MNNYPLLVFVDSDTATMIQYFNNVGINIDFDRLLKLMAENSEVIEYLFRKLKLVTHALCFLLPTQA